MAFATVTGNIYEGLGPELKGATGTTVSFSPVLLDDAADLVEARHTSVPVQKDGSIPPVSLWPGLWKITMLGGVYAVVLEAGVTYTLAALRGTVLRALAVPDTITPGQLLAKGATGLVGVDPGLSLPATVAEGDLLARAGDTVTGVNPASLGGGGGGSAPNWFPTTGTPAPDDRKYSLPGATFDSDAAGAVQLWLDYTYFSTFSLSVAGVVRKISANFPSSNDGLTPSTGSIALYRVDVATDTLERVELFGPFTQDGGIVAITYDQPLAAGMYVLGYHLTSAPLVDPGYAYPSTMVRSMGRVLEKPATFRTNAVIGLPASMPYSSSLTVGFDSAGLPMVAVQMGAVA